MNFMYVHEAGFNLTESIRGTVDLPGRRRGDMTTRAAISEHGVLTRIPLMGPFNTRHLLTASHLPPSSIPLLRALIPDHERGPFRDDFPKHVVISDNGSFRRSNKHQATVCDLR